MYLKGEATDCFLFGRINEVHVRLNKAKIMRKLHERTMEFQAPQILEKQGYYPFYQLIESGQDSEVLIGGEKKLMFGSNSYLGLTNHPEMIDVARRAVAKYGTGASGSRLMNGNLDLHKKLEDTLADFVGKPAATVYSTGFQTNLGTISCLLGRNDYIITDEFNHASIVDGCRLSFAKVYKYRHNDMESLEKVLQKTDSNRLILIVVDGIFSMEGDIARLDRISQLADQYGASVMVDDAHALGVLGQGGAGTASHFGLTEKTDLIMGTFSKSLASLGGFIASDFETINYIKHTSRSLLFSASIPPASAASALQAVEIIKREPERIQRLWDNTNYARRCLAQAGFKMGNSESPIIPIHIGNDMATYVYFTLALQQGLYVNPIVHPAVEKDMAMLRFSLMATHTREQIDRAVDILISTRKATEKKSSELISLIA